MPLDMGTRVEMGSDRVLHVSNGRDLLQLFRPAPRKEATVGGGLSTRDELYLIKLLLGPRLDKRPPGGIDVPICLVGGVTVAVTSAH